ncbi:MAG: septal ring lytic transglycosylase RlpA family protein [Pseudomonadota bacterium]
MRSPHWQGIKPLLIFVALGLAGCASSPVLYPPAAETPPARQPAPAAASAPVANNLPVLPPAGSGRGGYYKDDGPGDSIPPGLAETPDAEPKVEPYTTRGNRPYVVFGKSYLPAVDEKPFKQRGRGSWYGKKFHGQKTSSGEPYDMFKMTAAHPTLPLPSYARVTNLSNGRQVIVRVNDRGPFHSGRIIDLSFTAALKLGYITHGSSELEVERLLPDEIARMSGKRQSPSAGQPAPAVGVSMEAIPAPMVQALPVSLVTPAVAPEAAQLNVAGSGAQPSRPSEAASGYYLQLGAYSQASNAEAMRMRLAQNWTSSLPPFQVVQNGDFYRLFSGPYASRMDADAAALRMQTGGAARPLVVQR